eukprot:TRINITY_DN2977_c0_g1_i12.p1 TRINITY_DN2977_c0_g1~~TRINITY_DN2977_c0_g1_i12.p1  ORF type:complete len:127 (+),score=62.81 TRINITY_DN2977_c0_g1_i12:35-382(+)
MGSDLSSGINAEYMGGGAKPAAFGAAPTTTAPTTTQPSGSFSFGLSAPSATPSAFGASSAPAFGASSGTGAFGTAGNTGGGGFSFGLSSLPPAGPSTSTSSVANLKAVRKSKSKR